MVGLAIFNLENSPTLCFVVNFARKLFENVDYYKFCSLSSKKLVFLIKNYATLVLKVFKQWNNVFQFLIDITDLITFISNIETAGGLLITLQCI